MLPSRHGAPPRSVSSFRPHTTYPKNIPFVTCRPSIPALTFDLLGDFAGVHGQREFQDAALTAWTIRFSLLFVEKVRTSYLPAQDDVSHPDSERELVLWVGFGVEAREFGDQLVRRSIDWYLRISLRGDWFFIPASNCGYNHRYRTMVAGFRACWQSRVDQFMNSCSTFPAPSRYATAMNRLPAAA